MPSYFEKKLLELLPPLYERQDESGDFKTFLSVPAVTLDELKTLADRFPEIFDADQCAERFLPLLAEIVGWHFDPLKDAAAQRRLMREAIEFYRRKGTIPAIRRSLTDIGWTGDIEETFRKALRLNRRSLINRARLPGLIYSLGVYRISQDNLVQEVRSALVPHHPAGTRVFFLQWLYSMLSQDSDFEAVIKQYVQRVCLGHLHDAFVVSHNALNTDYHLTLKNKTWAWWCITDGTTLFQDVERAAVCISRWQGRSPCFRLNTGNLNGERLPNLWVSERRASFCCGIDTQPVITPEQEFISFTGQELNRARLNRSATPCRIKFRQKDFLHESEAELSLTPENARTHGYGNRSRLSHWFRVGHSRIGRDDRISGAAVGRHALLIAVASELWSEVRQAHDIVDRWRARRPGFSLNNRPLNITDLTDAYVTEARASFELDVDTGFPRRHRIETLLLNQRHLNHTGLRLSVDRTHPLRLGSMPLNGSGFRQSKPALRWRFRQRDDHAEAQAGIESAANRYEVTQWPIN